MSSTPMITKELGEVDYSCSILSSCWPACPSPGCTCCHLLLTGDKQHVSYLQCAHFALSQHFASSASRELLSSDCWPLRHVSVSRLHLLHYLILLCFSRCSTKVSMLFLFVVCPCIKQMSYWGPESCRR